MVRKWLTILMKMSHPGSRDATFVTRVDTAASRVAETA